MQDYTKTADAFRADIVRTFGVSGVRLALVDQLLGVYRRRGLLDRERDRPLHEVCSRAATCWQYGHDCLPEKPERSGIAVPWVGARYPATRICVVAINLDDWGGLDAHWYICHGYGDDLAAGRRGKGGLPFAHGVASYVDLVEASLARTRSVSNAIPLPSAVAGAWNGCAFLEAVKCSPDRPSAEPLDPMWETCPSLLLLDELNVLRPRVVILLGRTRLRDPVRRLLVDRAELAYGTSPGHMERDAFRVDGEQVDLLTLNHPSFPAWQKSYRRLAESLATEPL